MQKKRHAKEILKGKRARGSRQTVKKRNKGRERIEKKCCGSKAKETRQI